jgi:hypothetical protein
MEFKDDVFEGGGVLVAQEIVNQPGILPDGFGAFAVRDACGLDEAGVAAHVVHQSDEAVVENLIS